VALQQAVTCCTGRPCCRSTPCLAAWADPLSLQQKQQQQHATSGFLRVSSTLKPCNHNGNLPGKSQVCVASAFADTRAVNTNKPAGTQVAAGSPAGRQTVLAAVTSGTSVSGGDRQPRWQPARQRSHSSITRASFSPSPHTKHTQSSLSSSLRRDWGVEGGSSM
jgi:hypothetical protein